MQKICMTLYFKANIAMQSYNLTLISICSKMKYFYIFGSYFGFGDEKKSVQFSSSYDLPVEDDTIFDTHTDRQ